ncbi:MauE/DoxX family redox-associated membrane protein [Nocardia mexicana]|uniref:MauE/DoxX family redox-associated membrane protein n=1 Tax=Nocardia mexicana TaxID=279262 RepID=UPI00082D6E2D|nr:MauE/DoxX family redox-associated membrane protein [Nocardia mexicana]
MLIEYLVWVGRLALAAVFGLSAWAKLADPIATRKAVGEFGVPVRWTPTVATALPLVEAVLAAAMVPPWTSAAAAAVALVLLTMFTVLVIRLIRGGKRPPCSCFGAASTAPIGGRTVLRNGLLMLLAVLVGWGSLAYPEVPGALPVDRTVGMAAVAVLVAALVWVLGEVRALRRRVDEQALSTLGAEGLPVGAVAPEFELLDAAGERIGLAQLLIGGRQLLLVFVHPGCELCAALARELPRWHARTADLLTIVVVGNGDIGDHVRWGREQGLGEIPALVQQGNEAALRYRVRGTPSAVLIGREGRVAAPVARGAMAVRELIVGVKSAARQ